MTYEELAKAELGTPVEVRMPGKSPRRGELTFKVTVGERPVRAGVLYETRSAHGGSMQTCDYIPSVVHLICPLQQMSEIL